MNDFSWNVDVSLLSDQLLRQLTQLTIQILLEPMHSTEIRQQSAQLLRQLTQLTIKIFLEPMHSTDR